MSRQRWKGLPACPGRSSSDAAEESVLGGAGLSDRGTESGEGECSKSGRLPPNPAASPLLLPRFRRESAEIGRLCSNPAAPAPIRATCSPISAASRRLGSGSPARLVLSEIPGPALLLLLLKTDLVLARPCAAAN